MTQDAVWEGLSPGCLTQSRYETKGFGDGQVRLDLSGADPCLHLRGWVTMVIVFKSKDQAT